MRVFMRRYLVSEIDTYVILSALAREWAVSNAMRSRPTDGREAKTPHQCRVVTSDRASPSGVKAAARRVDRFARPRDPGGLLPHGP